MAQIIDVTATADQGAELGLKLKELCARFEREKDWPPEYTAQALLAAAYGFCRRAGWSPFEAEQRAGEQFAACESAFRKATKT